MLPYFIFKDIDSSDYLIVNKLPPIIKAKKNVEMIEIDGRDGFLTSDLGNYKSIIKPVECTIIDSTDIDFLCDWLDGTGEVIFSNEPDKKYKAVIINQIPFERVFAKCHTFLIQFEAQPHKYSLSNSIITLEVAGTIYNSGSAIALPTIKLFGTGSLTLTINGNIVNLTNVVDYVTINSDLMDCYKDALLKNNDMNGEFPILQKGNNYISWTGTVSKVEITPNFRYL